MAALAATLKRKGLKLGLWTIRGVHKDAVAKKLRIKGTNYTVDQIVDQHAFADGSAGDGIHSGRNLSCLWAPDWLGVNKSHPATQAYYDSRVELLASYGVSFIKADCMVSAQSASSVQADIRLNSFRPRCASRATPTR